MKPSIFEHGDNVVFRQPLPQAIVRALIPLRWNGNSPSTIIGINPDTRTIVLTRLDDQELEVPEDAILPVPPPLSERH